MNTADHVFFMVLTGTLVVTGLVVFIVFMVLSHYKRQLTMKHQIKILEIQKQNEIRDAIIKTQEEERLRIASNLHDGVGAELSMLKLNLSKHAYLLKNTYPRVEEMQTEIENLDRTVETLRETCRELYPTTLKHNDLVSSLEELLYKTADATGLNITFNNRLSATYTVETEERKLNLFRITQELLHNITKHARCRNLEMSVSWDQFSFQLDLIHDGNGLTNEHVSELMLTNKGVGLRSIANRVQLENGTINYSCSGQLSNVQIKIPSYDKQN